MIFIITVITIIITMKIKFIHIMRLGSEIQSLGSP